MTLMSETDHPERLADLARRCSSHGIDIARMRLDWLEHHVIPADKRDEYEEGFFQTAQGFLDRIEQQPQSSKLTVVKDIPADIPGQLTIPGT